MCVLLAFGASGPPAAQADRKPLPLRLVICRSVAPCAPAIAEAAGEFVGHGAGDPTCQAKQQRDFAERAQQVLRVLLLHPDQASIASSVRSTGVTMTVSPVSWFVLRNGLRVKPPSWATTVISSPWEPRDCLLRISTV